MIELHDSDFDSIDGFPLLWRWSDENHMVFVPQDLNLIRPLKPETSLKLHNKLLRVDQQNGLNCNLTNNLQEIYSNDDNDDTIQDWLIKLPVTETELILLSWTPEIAILTTWKLFTGRWSDFWYPSSDDLTVTSVSMDWVLAISHYGRIQWAEWING
jgi:hypothetical protein